MQKGLVKFLAIALVLISVFYLSFTVVTNKFYKQAKDYSGGNPDLESLYLDSLSTEKVWLGYTLKKCRSMEITLGLDLKGGMNVIMEIRPADVLKVLSDYNPDPIFNQALANTAELQAKGQNNDFITLFANQYKALDPNARLSAIFATYELREKITPQSTNEQVIDILRKEVSSAFDNSFNVLRTRIDRFGVVAPNIQKLESDGRISIELPGVKEPERIRTLLQGTANLEFWETFMESEIHQLLYTINNIIRDSIQNTVSEPERLTETSIPVVSEIVADTLPKATTDDDLISETADLLNETTGETEAIDNTEIAGIDNKIYPLFSLLGINPSQPFQSPAIARVKKSDMFKIDQYLNNSKVKTLLETNRLSLKWSVKPVDVNENYYELIALKVNYIDGKAKPVLNGDVITDARDDFGQHSAYAVVSMAMNSEGAKVWARLTRENIGKCIAIVLDNRVYSFPRVQVEITGGRSEITGNFTPEEAKDLANVLKSGKMAAPAYIVQEDIVGPSLGQQAINQGFISFFIALIVLMFYLIMIYGVKPGIIANGALFLNLFFTLGVMASFHVVLTLSGIAGIVLALAIAVDANVLIYERIKEEIRGGKSLKKAIEEGYQKAFSAIFDANLTSLITGFILLTFGTGPIRGFAFTLIIGIIISFFTAVFLTRVIYMGLLEKGKIKDIAFTTNISKNFLLNPNFDFLKKKKLLYTIITVVLLVCMGTFLYRGMNQGIDFTGGRNYKVNFNQPINTVEAQELLDPYFENHTPSVITIGTSNQVRISTNYKIASNELSVDEEITRKIYDALHLFLPEGTTYEVFINPDNGYILSSQKVGPSIADDMKTSAIWAIILAVIAIGLYVFLRFSDISYSIGTIFALSFDTLFIIGTYSLLWGIVPFSLEIDQTFIGAILTVVGYSVNDKVVIFDRVREYTKLYPKREKYEIFNASLNSTLNRTFNTSFSTLLVLLIIFFFAGESIRSFSFAMILGVVIGTTSSLLVAAPIAFEMQERNKRKIN
ncbi:MAG: protein translocase subunit SecDF [Dysgonamonadaceae bacterium]|jgi:SecD/SecF fusion protein|nr:protein translocase subunit SecDF [Dysgonamonadaceae bacterium]